MLVSTFLNLIFIPVLYVVDSHAWRQAGIESIEDAVATEAAHE